MNQLNLGIIDERKPLVDVAQELKMTVDGTVDQGSALKDGERMKVPRIDIGLSSP